MREIDFNNRPVIRSQTLQFVLDVPLVAQALGFVQNILNNHPILQRVVDLYECLFIRIIAFAMPLLNRVNKPLKQADDYAVQTLKFVKGKVPYPFEASWSDLYARGKGNINQAHQMSQDIYESHIKAPAKSIYEQTGKAVEQLQQNENAYVQKTGSTIAALHEKFLGLSKEMSDKTSQEVAEGEKKASGMVNGLLSEIEGLEKFATTLPAEAQKRLEPYVNVLSSTYKDLSKEAVDNKVPIRERLNKAASYLQNNTLPELQNIISTALKSDKKSD